MKKTLTSLFAVALIGMSAASATAADIVDTAVGAGKFKTLAAALGAADLVDTLKGDGPFTVFAPTDAAFEKLPAGTVETLLKPENKGKLAGVLTYHVVAGKVMAEQVVGLKGAQTVNGQRVDIKVDGSSVMVDGANVVTTDIVCDNGVIHIIDSVILPADKTIPETADAAGSFKTLLAAAKAAGLAEVLGSEGPFTVFAPTDEAFAKLPEGTVASLLKPENKEKLVAILKYHVVAGRVYSEDAVAAKSAKTLQGSPVAIKVTDGGAMINDSKVVATDVDASNGVIHIIDAVLLPPENAVDARRVIENTVAQGAHLFNAGHHAACADLYHNTMTELMSANLGDSLNSHMSTVLTSANHTTCPTQRAWTLRTGIDQMYGQIVANR
ncbi:putative Sensory subunit of low CO2-induced protein complex [Rhodopirellula islandica]|uniref:Sensory subunit of low CO2-induced protein complex n=1 Tax=Rhodopirellula islandica TaxID=595434 RepID=A0A0J1B8P7_RHOIS|nr:fasciclin domain-containing protein [Rhodopirellula islandica]KLU02831.1 putative Sensory subunit of low CO2-induced protein complex [Rhodopirellula islandica]